MIIEFKSGSVAPLKNTSDFPLAHYLDPARSSFSDGALHGVGLYLGDRTCSADALP